MRDVDTLPRCVLSVVCHMIEAVSTALSHKQTVYKTPSGREVCGGIGVAYFSVEPDSSSEP